LQGNQPITAIYMKKFTESFKSPRIRTPDSITTPRTPVSLNQSQSEPNLSSKLLFSNQQKLPKPKKKKEKEIEVLEVQELPSYKELTTIFPFDFCCEDSICSKAFEKCLDREKCSENLFFYTSVLRFKKVKDDTVRKETALMILQGFILIGSSLEVNLTDKEKLSLSLKFENILESEKEFPLDFFDEFLQSVVLMLKIDQYPKFLTSVEFKQYFYKHGHERVDKKSQDIPMDVQLIEPKNELPEDEEITEDVMDILFSLNRKDEIQKNFNHSNRKRNKKNDEFESHFPFEFCLNDKNCKPYFSEYLGSLFLLYENILTFKKTEIQKTRKEIASMIISLFLMPSAKFETKLSKKDKNQAIQKFQFLGGNESPKDAFDELFDKILNIFRFDYLEFFKSKQFQEYFKIFKYSKEKEVVLSLELNTILKDKTISKGRDIRALKELFPFEFCLSDKTCKIYFSQYLGTLFVLNEQITTFKQTPYEKIRKEMCQMIVNNFLLPNSRFESSLLSKKDKTDSIKKYNSNDKTISNDLFDGLQKKINEIMRFQYSTFFESKEWEIYFENFGKILLETDAECLSDSESTDSLVTSESMNNLSNNRLELLIEILEKKIKERENFYSKNLENLEKYYQIEIDILKAENEILQNKIKEMEK
jgi:hypothetical protein